MKTAASENINDVGKCSRCNAEHKETGYKTGETA